MTGRLHSAAAVLIAVAVLVGASGCSILWPRPPDSVPAAVTAALDTLRATDGVASADAEIDQQYGANPEVAASWRAIVTVVAAPDAAVEALAGAVDEVTVTLLETVPARVSLDFPATAGLSAATFVLSDDRESTPTPTPDLVAAALALRAVDGATAVIVWSDAPPQVTLEPEASWVDIVHQLRALPDFGGERLPVALITTDIASLTVDAASPSDALLTALEGLVTTHGATWLDFAGNRAADLGGDDDGWRPSLTVEAPTRDAAELMIDELVALDAAVLQSPRPHFRVLDGNTSTGGYLGLPRDSAAPDDLVPAIPLPPFDAAASEAQLAADLIRVAVTLDTAGRLAGIAGTPSVSSGPCDEGVGELVSGSVIIPIFEIENTADAAFERIVDAWIDEGFANTDRALGTDIYTSIDSRRTIRGTAEGIRITEKTACTWP